LRGRKYTLKTLPSDFVVEEVLLNEPEKEGKGEYGIFRLTKEGLDTHAALKIVAARVGVPYRAIGCAGLKDRYSRSVQYVSLKGKGPELNFKERSLSLEFVGKARKGIQPGDHGGNRFSITIRKMDTRTLSELKRGIERMTGLPVPNYFDSQRFGSLRRGSHLPSEGFTPHFTIVEVLKGNHEGALKELLTGTYRKERSGIKALKRALATSWGDWNKCSELATAARYENYSEIFEFLRNAGTHIGDGKNGTTQKEPFISALRLVRDRTLRMEGLALLDYLWNEALKSKIYSGLGLENIMTVRYEAGELYFPRANDFALDRYREMILREKRGVPLPSSEIRDGELREGYERLLDGLGLDLLALSALRDWGISAPSEPRPPFVMSDGLELTEGRDSSGAAGMTGENDNTESGQRKGAQRTQSATLSFTLPPGSYATVVVKALLG